MKKKIVLFMPTPVSYARSWRGAPLSLLAISRILAQEGYEIKIISRFLSDNPEEEVLKEAKDSICLGITAMIGFQIRDGLKIARLVKKKYPKLPIVWGGWHPSILPEETVANKYVDIVVKGQGERTFTKLVHALEEGKNLGGIAGISYQQNGRVYSNKVRPLEDINNFPPLPYHLIDVEKCITPTEYGQRSLFYLSSYGCPFRCGFCVEPIVYKRHWTGLAAERVVEDWAFLVKKYCLDTIVVSDSNFFVDKKRVYDICRGLLKKRVKVKWRHANGRIPQLVNYEPEIWEVMEKSGCGLINTGAESGSQQALNLIKKDMEVSDIIKFSCLCEKYNIKVQFSFLVGLPWSKDAQENEKLIEQEYQNTISLIDRLYQISNRNRFTYYIYLPYPGAPLFNRAVSLGLKIPRSLEGWSNYLLSPEDAFETVTRQKWISPQQARRVNMLSQYIFALMDKDTLALVNDLPDGVWKFAFRNSFSLAQKLAKLRWKYKFFSLPFDYWLFNWLHKKGKLD